MEFLQELTLELNSNTAYTTIGAKQGDGNSRILKIHITKDGKDWKIPANVNASYRVRKPDGYAVWNEGIIDTTENVVNITLTEQTLAAAGRAYADLVFSLGTGDQRQILSTVSFIIIIMAAPDITEQVVSSNEFGDILDLTENAKIILNEGEAWAIGSKSGVPVLADSFSYSVEGNSQLEVTIDPTIFREYFGISPGYTTYYIFTCTASRSSQYPNGIWQVTWGNQIILDIESEDQPNGLTLASFGISIEGIALQSNIIRVIVTDSDEQYHNNSKYWSQMTYNAQESIENLDATAEKIDQTAQPEVEKTTVHDVSITEQPDGWDVQINDTIFIARVGQLIGDYIFYYDINKWTLNGATINFIDYGISNVPASANDGDTIIVHYNQHKRFNFKIPQGETGNVNFMTFYVGTDPTGVDYHGNSTYGQIVMNRPTELTEEQITFRLNNEGYLEVLMDAEV